MAVLQRDAPGSSQLMRQRSFVVVAVVVGVLIAGVAAAWIDDSARKLLGEKLAAPLEQPLVVRYGHRKFTLSAARAHLTTDVNGMVDEALAKSRSGNVITRAFRGVTGGSVDENVPP